MPQLNFLKRIYDNFSLHAERNAFFIKGRYFTYRDLSSKISVIQANLLRDFPGEKYAGVVLNDDLETYASILALWFSGMAFVPVNPMFPSDRNLSILSQTGIKLLLHSSLEGIDRPVGRAVKKMDTLALTNTGKELPAWKEPVPDDDLYVLFTSGSTGIPKGVRLSVSNLDVFTRDFIGYPAYNFTPEDRFLQIYDLSFDASIHCYTVPLIVGACVYTVPQDEIKYLAAYKLMLNQKLTFVKMPPSTLAFLKPYFPSIRLPDLKYCLLGGEAFPSVLAKEWEPCVPNALIQNVYGPTEVTINCLIYDWNGAQGSRKEHGGTVSIGKAFGSNIALVMNENSVPAKPFETGELWMGGGQVSPGYWKNETLNRSMFADMDHEGQRRRFYRTGDVVMADGDGDIMYIGRRDEQVQVQGYRVELGEIEEAARNCLDGANVMAFGKETGPGQMKIYLLIEAVPVDQKYLMEYLVDHLPSYMVPSKALTLDEFPRLVSGKLDRKALQQMIPDE